MQELELSFYAKVKNWDFSHIHRTDEVLTNWNMYMILQESVTSSSKILDLGTGGGEKLISNFPEVEEIVGTDFSPEMIETAKSNLLKSGRGNIRFEVMDNLNMTTPDNYFDVVVARNTCIDAQQIYKTLKDGGLLLLHGVDKLDCWELKRLFGYGQAYKDIKPISLVDFENIIDAGFKHIELVPIYVREYYKTKEDLLALLMKTPILTDFSEIEENTNLKTDNKIDEELLDKYILENTYEKGILLKRRYYGITAYKRTKTN